MRGELEDALVEVLILRMEHATTGASLVDWATHGLFLPERTELRRAYVGTVSRALLAGRLEAEPALERIHRSVVSPLGHPPDLSPWCYAWEGLDDGDYRTLSAPEVTVVARRLASGWATYRVFQTLGAPIRAAVVPSPRTHMRSPDRLKAFRLVKALRLCFVLLSWVTLPLSGQDLTAADVGIPLDSAVHLAQKAAVSAFPDLSSYLLYSVTPRVIKGDPRGLHWLVQWQDRAFPHRRWLVVRVYMRTVTRMPIALAPDPIDLDPAAA
jgi:hypothetical protein